MRPTMQSWWPMLRVGMLVAFVSFATALLGQPVSAVSDPAPAETQSVAALLRKSASLAQEGRFAEAKIVLQQALANAPRDFRALVALGKVDARLGEMVQGTKLLRKATIIDPGSAEAHFDLALVLADAGQLPAALAEVSTAEKLMPRNERFHLNRGRMLAQLHRPAAAAHEYATAKILNPMDPNVYFYWALLERNQGNLGEESKLLVTLTRLAPQNSRDYYLLGQSLASQGKSEAAIAALREAVKLNPQEGNALYLLAMEMRKKNPQAARALLARFQHLQQLHASLSHIKTLGNMAVIASSHGDWPKAIALFREAVAQCGSCSIEAGLRKDLGLDLCRDGQIAAGKDQLEKSLRLNPNDMDTLRALRILHEAPAATNGVRGK